MFMVFNITFNNISVISWWSVLLVDEMGGVPGENHQQTVSHNVVFSAPHHEHLNGEWWQEQSGGLNGEWWQEQSGGLNGEWWQEQSGGLNGEWWQEQSGGLAVM
jgi:hypothetical protein